MLPELRRKRDIALDQRLLAYRLVAYVVGLDLLLFFLWMADVTIWWQAHLVVGFGYWVLMCVTVRQLIFAMNAILVFLAVALLNPGGDWLLPQLAAIAVMLVVGFRIRLLRLATPRSAVIVTPEGKRLAAEIFPDSRAPRVRYWWQPVQWIVLLRGPSRLVSGGDDGCLMVGGRLVVDVVDGPSYGFGSGEPTGFRVEESPRSSRLCPALVRMVVERREDGTLWLLGVASL